MKADWEIKKLGEVCEIKCGATPLKSDKSFWENGTIPWFTIDDIRSQGRIIKYTLKSVTEKALKKLTLFPKNTVLLCCTASVGEYAITDIELTCNQQFNGLIIKNQNYLYPYYLFYFASTLKSKLLSVSGKTTIDFVSNSKVCEIEIPVPSLPEQRRIVEILDQKFAQIDQLKQNAEKNLQNAKELFQAELEKALSNISWKKKNLGSLSTEKMSYGSSSPSCNYNGEIRYIRITDINDNGFLNEEFVSPKNYEEKHILKDGDIVFARTGATVGKAYCYKESEGKSVYAGYLIRLRPNRELVIPDFIYLNTKSKDYENFIKNSQAAAAQPNVNAEKYSNYEIPLPPLSEQQKIVAHLDALQEKVRQLEEIYTKQIANCDELKQSFLKKAFEGEL